jgi:hypothetical protein
LLLESNGGWIHEARDKGVQEVTHLVGPSRIDLASGHAEFDQARNEVAANGGVFVGETQLQLLVASDVDTRGVEELGKRRFFSVELVKATEKRFGLTNESREWFDLGRKKPSDGTLHIIKNGPIHGGLGIEVVVERTGGDSGPFGHVFIGGNAVTHLGKRTPGDEQNSILRVGRIGGRGSPESRLYLIRHVIYSN